MRIIILLFMLFSLPAFADTSVQDTNNQSTTWLEKTEQGLKKAADKTGEVLKKTTNKTKQFMKDNFNQKKFDETSKKAANATKKTWQQIKEGSQDLYDKTKQKFQSKDNAKKECDCNCSEEKPKINKKPAPIGVDKLKD